VTLQTTTVTETATTGIDGRGRQSLALAHIPVQSVQSITPQLQGMPTVDITTLKINNDAGIVYPRQLVPVVRPASRRPTPPGTGRRHPPT